MLCNDCIKKVAEKAAQGHFPQTRIITGAIILLFVIAIVFFATRNNATAAVPTTTGNNQPIIIQQAAAQYCPFECCTTGNYQLKDCATDYECIQNHCQAKDTDGDGLTDSDEKARGTNPRIADTDSDGLTDYREVQIGSNPLNDNTDGDRYKDGADADPIRKNSAKIELRTVNEKKEVYTVKILGELWRGMTNLNPDFAVGKYSFDIQIQNTGTDYTEYANLDVVFVEKNEAGTTVRTLVKTLVSIGKLTVGQSKTQHFERELTVSDAGANLVNSLLKSGGTWGFEIQNLEYEQFV